MIKTTHVTADEVALIRTCVHEAAHAVVATVLGGAIHCASAAFAGGSTTCEHLPEDVAGAVAFAGPYAEAFWEAGTGRHPDPWQITAATSRRCTPADTTDPSSATAATPAPLRRL